VRGGRPPPREHREDRDEGERIGQEGRGHARRGHHRAAQRRPDRAADVEAERVQRDRRAQFRARDKLGDDGLPGRVGQRRADAGGERQRQQQHRRHQPRRGEQREEQRQAHQPCLGREEQPPPVQQVGQRARRQCEEKHRQRGRRLHRRDPGRARGEVRHQPAQPDIAHPGAGVRDDHRQPHVPHPVPWTRGCTMRRA
jgi:hypothetical protein